MMILPVAFPYVVSLDVALRSNPLSNKENSIHTKLAVEIRRFQNLAARSRKSAEEAKHCKFLPEYLVPSELVERASIILFI